MSALSVSIDTGTPSADHRGQHGRQPRAFLLGRYPNGAAIRPGRFRADIENVRAFRHEPAGLRNRGLRIEEASAVGK